MNRQELGEYMKHIFEKEILPKFNEKNQSYGSEKNSAFYNFEQTGTRLASNQNINLDDLDKHLLPLFAYTDKHQVALMQNLSKTPEFEERIIDIIVYSFIALTMKANLKKQYNEYDPKEYEQKWVTNE